jgi:hypothetical protein
MLLPYHDKAEKSWILEGCRTLNKILDQWFLKNSFQKYGFSYFLLSFLPALCYLILIPFVFLCSIFHVLYRLSYTLPFFLLFIFHNFLSPFPSSFPSFFYPHLLALAMSLLAPHLAVMWAICCLLFLACLTCSHISALSI